MPSFMDSLRRTAGVTDSGLSSASSVAASVTDASIGVFDSIEDTTENLTKSVKHFFDDQLESVRVLNRMERERFKPKANWKINIKPERVRFFGYIFFWTMCLLAIVITNTTVKPLLLEGPTDGKSCPPFETGEGFDFDTDSHLVRAFGFNNICANWDYSPSREIVAAYYPAFEYAILAYIMLDYLSVSVHYRKGLVSKRFYLVFKFCLPFLIVFTAWFRLIFVGIAYINVQAHTFGFLMLQFVLVAIALLNVWYINESNQEYKMFCGYTKWASRVYLICNWIISSIKIYLTAYVVFTGGYPSWANTPISASGEGLCPGQIIDQIWMIFNAVVPLVMSYVRSVTENPLEITVDFKPPKIANEEDWEGFEEEEERLEQIPEEGEEEEEEEEAVDKLLGKARASSRAPPSKAADNDDADTGDDHSYYSAEDLQADQGDVDVLQSIVNQHK